MVVGKNMVIEEEGHYHDCCCEHDHAVFNYSYDKEPIISGVNVTLHGKAVIGSFSGKIEGTYENTLDEMKRRLQRVAKEVEDSGGLIGHIKAFVKEDAGSCMISLTEKDDLQVKLCNGNRIFINGASIVFNIAPDDLEKIIKKIIK